MQQIFDDYHVYNLISTSPMILSLFLPPSPSPSQGGATPVYIAAQNNHVAALELLIKANADVNKAKQVREPLRGTTFFYVSTLHQEYSTPHSYFK